MFVSQRFDRISTYSQLSGNVDLDVVVSDADRSLSPSDQADYDLMLITRIILTPQRPSQR